MKNALLSLKEISVSFGGLQALDQIDLLVEKNSVSALIGPNGAGKTTLFNVISGLVKPDSGTFSYSGKSIPFPKPDELAGLNISRTLQGVGLFNDLTVLENVMIGADKRFRPNFLSELVGRSRKRENEIAEAALAALAWVGAADLAAKKPSELSYPDSKKVALARALAVQPKLLLLDEPAAGLGQDDIDRLAELILNLKRKMSILIVEHHVDFVGKIADDVNVLNFGKLIASGPFDAIKRDPKVIEAYLGHDVTH